MGAFKSPFGFVAALVPIVYIGGMLYYFSGFGSSMTELTAAGLGPTVLGLGAIFLLLCVPLAYRLLRTFSDARVAAVKSGNVQDFGDDGDGFDPDAALARYMARKAEGGVDVAPVEAIVRPQGFGRKGA